MPLMLLCDALQVCRIHCATSNPTSVVLAKTSDDAVVSCLLTAFHFITFNTFSTPKVSIVYAMV